MTRRKLAGAALVAVIRVTVATAGFAQEASARPTVAIADVSVAPGGWTLPPPQLSGAIVEMLVNELVSAEKFHVYDGEWLVPEAEIGGRTDMARLRQAAESEHLDYLVVGTVTAFSMERRKKGGLGVIPVPIVFGALSREQMQLSVAITLKVVDVRTGEIVTTASAQGIGRRHSTTGGGLALVGPIPLPLAAAATARSLNARDAMLDEAVHQAVHDAAVALAQSAGTMTAATGRQSPAGR